MHPNQKQSKWAILAVLTTASCFAMGAGCIQAALASIGATFF